VYTGSIALTALDPSSDTRGLAFSEDGTRAFVVDRAPPALLVIDTSLEDGLPRNQIIDAIALCPEPSLLYLKRIGGANRAYVVCFAAGSAYVVDTDALRLIDTITLGRGPNAMAFSLDHPDQPLGFVANYVENDIGVIDLLPGSPTEHQVIARIGYPSPVQSN
jgi:DNA-binding beta-propeller fold protein YncE